MRLSNGEVLLRWPLAKHIITQGWYYNDGGLHQAIDLRTQLRQYQYTAGIRCRGWHAPYKDGAWRTGWMSMNSL